MQEIKNIIGIVAVVLTFAGYVPYLRDITKGKTKPHIYSWFLWGFVTLIAFALQVAGKAGAGSLITLAAALMCIAVIFLGYKFHSQSDITKTDTIFFILSFIALGIWVFAKQPVISVILVTTIDLLGFVPTIRKSWNKPYTETLSFYFANTLRFALGILALYQYTIITSLYPITWLMANGLFAVMLIVRRKQLGVTKN